MTVIYLLFGLCRLFISVPQQWNNHNKIVIRSIVCMGLRNSLALGEVQPQIPDFSS